MKKWILLALAFLGAYTAFTQSELGFWRTEEIVQSGTGAAQDILKSAFENQQSNIQFQESGRVQRMLSDDNDGSRHQRFIVELSSGQTLLIAHNIDLAARIDSLREGDSVEFYGEYEWNPQGGVVHWTHHDPAGRHVGGWVKYGGRTYQ